MLEPDEARGRASLASQHVTSLDNPQYAYVTELPDARALSVHREESSIDQ